MVTVKGTPYKKDVYIFGGKTEEELEVSKIELVIVHHGSVSFISEIIFVCEVERHCGLLRIRDSPRAVCFCEARGSA